MSDSYSDQPDPEPWKVQEAYWQLVTETLVEVFERRRPHEARSLVDSLKRRLDEAKPEIAEKVFQCEPFTVAADLIDRGNASIQPEDIRRYLEIKKNLYQSSFGWTELDIESIDSLRSRFPE